MSNQDSFVDEVSEELRRDRLFGFFRRYGWIGILAAVLIVAGAAFTEWRDARARASAEAFGDALLAALQSDSGEARAEALATVTPPEGARAEALAAFLTAASEATARNPAAAIAALRPVADDPDLPQAWRDLAVLKATMLADDTLAPGERLARLEPLSAPGAPFRLLALEQMALAEIEAGNEASALGLLREVAADAGVAEAQRRRVLQLIIALGGQSGAA